MTGGYQTDMTNLFWGGDGGLHTTLNDLLKWDQHFYSPSLGRNPDKLISLLNKPNSEFSAYDGFGLYANGQVVTKIDGYDAYMHSGSYLGVQTIYIRIPAKKLSTIVLCNDADKSVYPYAKDIISLYLDTH
ncbi:hypothetical protein [Motilimonas sp. E26]|uniref:hypothetical protein n=1 Tax=Motilimonas sp. E26 TaxID=2865674 RepID=UPI001E61F1F8|nr:hypothetical protein [Motilimonas sp. E26]MCE0556985.1 hypothetical protein [Motilimonas sp. E26]